MKKKLIIVLLIITVFLATLNTRYSHNIINYSKFNSENINAPYYDVSDSLNTFYNSLEDKDKYIKTNTKFLCTGENITCTTSPTFTNIGMLNMAEYEIVGGPKSYLSAIDNYWTMSESESNAYQIFKTGILLKPKSSIAGIRPTIYIKEGQQIKGNGTYNDPYEFDIIDTPPVYTAESCFEVDGNIINLYYEYEDNDPSKPKCPADVVIPSVINGTTITAIGDWGAFAPWWYSRETPITSVEIPNSVTYIGIYAFFNNQLTSVEIPSGVTTIGDSAFAYNQLPSVEIPSSVTTIGSEAFESNSLASVVIPSSVTTIGAVAFRYNQLTSVEIPSSITSINHFTFSNNKLTSVIIPSSVTKIFDGAFYRNHLTSVTIPSSVTSIGYEAFWDNQLTRVTIKGKTYPSFYGQYIWGWAKGYNDDTAMVWEP